MKTWLEIDKKALNFNLDKFRQLIGPKVKLAAIIKSNAYGHGLVEVAKIAQNKADWLGVDSIYEALILKNNNITKPILILGYTPKNNLNQVIANNFRQTVYNPETIKILSKIAVKLNKKVYLHLKLETGTSRQGILEKDISKVIKFIKQNKLLIVEGLSTHFANIEDTTDHTYAQKQLETFKKLTSKIDKQLGYPVPIKHTACSAATILFPETHFNMVRLGISMYGLWSSTETFVCTKNGRSDKLKNFSLKPALTWKTIIAQIKQLKAGTPISYGLTEILTHDSKIAILPIGYWDGYDRKLSSIGNVLISGKCCKVLGRVCMNMIIVDITHLKKVKLEDEVVLLGKQGKEQITTEEMARKIGTINYEVITRINPLIKRIVI